MAKEKHNPKQLSFRFNEIDDVLNNLIETEHTKEDLKQYETIILGQVTAKAIKGDKAAIDQYMKYVVVFIYKKETTVTLQQITGMKIK
jgi:uncharacterized protein YktA (UPF0223 family)